VIGFLLTQYSPSAIGAAVARGNWLPMIPIVFGGSIWALVFMATADWVLFAKSLGQLKWFDVLRAKAGCSVIQAVNHSVGQGAYGIWLGRRTKSDVRTTVGVMAYLIVTDLVALFAIVSVAVWLTEPEALPRAEILRWLAPTITIGLVVAASAAPRILPRYISKARFLLPWLKIDFRTFVLIIVIRLLAVGGVMTAICAASHVFGVPLPLLACLAYLPIIFLAGALPINVLGFGAVQLV